MKTSTVLLLTAFLILLGSLAAYNMALKNEYNKGTYKDPYHNYITLNYRDFDQVEINPATEMNVKIKAGPFSVQVHPHATDLVKIKK
ncbi:hypothetical protein AHMF7605_02790 [Adhaeribacter arboris]|uniref:Uncharacterized protein n=1 Tax=Adhaeribacter arboris TaxID=2072846 RepID=A0A2T2YAL6_9BACT|nr:hypothetical protein [Adhaeribacter arboris]PSR52526.1 hypothetical protein AHMF7605_02790 [Adhaeribacter arboris]